MLKNYLTIAVRHLARQKGYAVLNVLGLALGTAVCLLIAGYVAYEISFDRFHAKGDRIYRVAMGHEDLYARAPLPIGPLLPEHVAGIEKSTRYTIGSEVLVAYDGERHYEDGFASVDPEFFEIFDFEVLRGDPSAALAEPFTVFISASKADRYFGEMDPVGQILRIDNAHDYEVRGVYVRIAPDVVRGTLDLLETKWAEYFGGEPMRYAFVDDYLGQQYASDVRLGRLLGYLAILTILVACVGLFGLAAYAAQTRTMEIGIRKVLGATVPDVVGMLSKEFAKLVVVAAPTLTAGARASSQSDPTIKSC